MVEVVAAALAALAPICCVDAGLKASYEPTTPSISAQWRSPHGGAAVELRVSDRLDANGVADKGSPRSIRVHVSGGRARLHARRVATVLDTRAGVFVQVRFTCPARTAAGACATGEFWSRPFHLTAEAGIQAPANDTSWQRVQIASNGTQACLDAFDDLRAVIKALTKNTRSGKPAAEILRIQQKLLVVFKRLKAAAERACAKQEGQP